MRTRGGRAIVIQMQRQAKPLKKIDFLEAFEMRKEKI